MNIFEIFCEGDGRINEANMSSALHFLLNPNAPHGFHVTPLSEFLAPLADQLKSLCEQKYVINPYKIFELGSFLRSFKNIKFELESKVFNPTRQVGSRNNRRIDLVIKFFRDLDDNQQPSFLIAVENKINENSAGNEQLIDEYGFLRAQLNSDYAATEKEAKVFVPVIFIYLTKNKMGRGTESEWNRLDLPTAPGVQKNGDFKAHYSWQPFETENSASIASLVKKLIDKEQSGSINPASSYSSLFLRSMLNFISNDFKTESKKYEQDQAELDRSNSVQSKEAISSEAFWKSWENKKLNSLSYAKQIYKSVSDEFSKFHVTERFYPSRVSFLSETKRYGAIVLQHSTQARVEVEIRRNKDHNVTEELQKKCDELRINIDDDNGCFNLCVPIDVPIDDSMSIIAELIHKSCEELR